MLVVRQAHHDDIPMILNIFEKARNFMRSTGNESQWINGYPSRELMEEEVRKEHCHVIINDDSIVASFCFIKGNDSTYNYIENGNWINEEPYGVIHRLASDGSVKGIIRTALHWCFIQCNNIRVDTHSDNKVMRYLLQKEGFTECGVIYVSDDSPRIAFQKLLKA